MRAPSFAQLPTVRHRIHVDFDVLNPRTGAGTRSRIPVEVDVHEDRHGVSPPDGVYADAGRGRNRLVTYCRVGDTGFAPLPDAALGNCPDIVLEDPDPGRQLARLKFSGQYALPRRFDDVLSSDRRLHAATGRRIRSPSMYVNPNVTVAAIPTVTMTAMDSDGISAMVSNTKMMPPMIHRIRCTMA